MTILLRTLVLAAAMAGLGAPAGAQSLFAPVATVDQRVITGFELQQRARMLAVFRSPGDLERQALDALIDERVQLAEADRLDIEASDEEVAAGMEEFAGRVNLSTEAFLAELAQAGVEPESFRAFIRAGVLWRRIVRAQLGETLVVQPIEIDRAAGAPPPAASLEFLLNEIILPADSPERRAQVAELAPRLTGITSFATFEAAAREISASVSRQSGGRIPPIPTANLPPPIRQQLLALEPGQVAGPVQIPNAAVFFQLRGINEVPAPPDTRDVEFALLTLPGGRDAPTLAQAAAIEARVDTCDDLYTAAPGLPIQRDRVAPSRLPADIALELAKLDAGEISTNLRRPRGLAVLMLCGRGTVPEDEVNRDAVRERLFNARLSGAADAYLAELRANAVIVRR